MVDVGMETYRVFLVVGVGVEDGMQREGGWPDLEGGFARIARPLAAGRVCRAWDTSPDELWGHTLVFLGWRRS